MLSDAFAEGVGAGTISGRVIDSETGSPVEGVTVILFFPDPGNGTDARQEIARSGPVGDYEFDAMPAGAYSLSFIKSGFRASSMANFEVVAGQDNVANFPMPRTQTRATGGDVLELDAFVVEATVVGDLLEGMELRLESDQLLNLLSADDLSKYAASDVADALKRVAGVNIVDGQFAVVRGLEDRYSSTLFNGAPVPSPDPDSQSVQLDLFPSDIVSNLVIAKTFVGSSPSNSSGGSINIMTQTYPEELEFKVSLGTGFEERALDRFIEFDSGSPTGGDARKRDVTESDFSVSFGGHYPILGREIRFKSVVAHEIDYRSEVGLQETQEAQIRGEVPQRDGTRRVTSSGDLALGELSLSAGRFDQLTSTRQEQLTAFLGFGLDLDRSGDHRLDATIFYTESKDQSVSLRENGFLPGADYSALIQATEDEDDLLGPLRSLDAFATIDSRLAGAESSLRLEVDDSPGRGALWFGNFGRSNSRERQRNLQVYQLNGEHEFDLFGGIDVSWAANHATTSLQESSRGMRFTFEPCGFSGQFGCPAGVSRIATPRSFPARVSDLGPGTFFASGPQGGIVFSDTEIDESQWFGRIDVAKEFSPADFVNLKLTTGAWWEKSRRGVDSLFVETVTVNTSSQFELGAVSRTALGSSLFSRFDSLDGNRKSTTRAGREIAAGHLTLKTTFWDDLDLVGGIRLERIKINSENDPFTGNVELNSRPQIFPTAFLFFDRRDNPDPALQESVPAGSSGDVGFNDQILGLDLPINPDTGFVDFLTREQILSVVNGEIDEFRALPAVSLTYRPMLGLTIRGAYSETVARPSFREIGYYVTLEPGTDDRVVGNPQLELSDVKNFDARIEYVHGDFGDLFAFSAFYKTIDRPIESIVLRNPLDFDGSSEALFKTFFNNPGTARLWGIEVEGRKSFEFIPFRHLEYLSLGGNFTYIEAKVPRSPVEVARANSFFGVIGDDRERFSGLERERRLFGQPEWIANADLTFDHPEWGTKVALSIFAISDILEAAGTTALGRNNLPESNRLDRYLDEFYQLDLVASQRLWDGLTARVSVKNLTDTARRRVYDQDQTRRKVTERLRRSGRDWSFSLAYKHEF